MEWRRRRKFGRRATVGGYAARRLAIGAVFVAVIALISLSSLGAWLSTKVFAPLFSTAAPSSAAQAKTTLGASETLQEQNPAARSISIPAVNCYALQMGVFSNPENAENQSAELMRLGAAGYIRMEDSQYRVLAAGYTSEEDLKSVREQLAADGLDSASYPIKSAACRLAVTGTEDEVSACQAAADALVSLLASLAELPISFDRDKATVEAGLAQLRAIYELAKQNRDALAAAQDGGDPVAEALLVCFDNSISQMSDILANEEIARVALSASLKRLYLALADDLTGAVNAQNPKAIQG